MSAAARCHYCRSPVGWPGCRQEHYGWYCVQRGLQLGEGVELVVPEPPSAPWEQAPEVLAAAEAETLAEAEYATADAAWRTAYQQLSDRRIHTAFWTFDRGQFLPRKGQPKDQGLIDAEAETKTRREDAAEVLRAARVAHHDALTAAEWQHRTTTQVPAAVPRHVDLTVKTR